MNNLTVGIGTWPSSPPHVQPHVCIFWVPLSNSLLGKWSVVLVYAFSVFVMASGWGQSFQNIWLHLTNCRLAAMGAMRFCMASGDKQSASDNWLNIILERDYNGWMATQASCITAPAYLILFWVKKCFTLFTQPIVLSQWWIAFYLTFNECIPPLSASPS
jgi:hypothetical protein